MILPFLWAQEGTLKGYLNDIYLVSTFREKYANLIFVCVR